jgi:NADP-dependent aldehyde dehydrogenase
MTAQSVDPRTGTPFGPQFPDTTPDQLDAIVAAARAAFPAWAATPDPERARVLDQIAAALDERAPQLAELADRETGLGAARLAGEVARTTFQLRMFAQMVRAGAHHREELDEPIAGAPPQGRPELRRRLVPLGVVAVFGASNFPFAFGVCGGDTAAALAAGCPVVAKAHPNHPQTSAAVADTVTAALARAGAPEGTFALVHGLDTGRSLVTDARVSAAAFTGSHAAGRALYDLACAREQPIPFYGELGSVNPVIATAGALAGRVAEFAREYADSLTLGSGQFCTNPGLLLAPSGHGVAQAAAEELSTRGAQLLLHAGIGTTLTEHLATVASLPGTKTAGALPGPVLVEVPLAAALADPATLATECFGPVGVLVEYDTLDEATRLLRALPGCLVATIHATEREPVGEVIRVLTDIAGRVVWNGWPTGLAVSPAQHHGGPYPASTSSRHTSVGWHAVDRFLRPVVFQNLPAQLLPSGPMETSAVA